MARQALLATAIVVISVSGCASAPQRTNTEAGSGGFDTPAASTAAATSPGSHSCPPGVGPSTDAHGDVHDAAIDYADVLRFGGHNYQSVDNAPVTHAELGAGVGRVVCTLSGPVHIDPDYRMRDGDATFVPAGSTIYTLKGVQSDRELAAEHDGVMHLYKALPAS